VARSDELPTERIEIISFWPDACIAAANYGFKTRPILACAYSPKALTRWAVDAGIHGIILEGSYFAAAVVEPCRDAGLSIMSGLVNDARLLERVLLFNPDAVASDRPTELMAELNLAS
jgi:hypothetical protein